MAYATKIHVIVQHRILDVIVQNIIQTYVRHNSNTNFSDLEDTHKTATIVLQIVLGFLYLILLILSSTAFYFSQRNSSGLVLVTNVRSIIFGLMFIISVTQGFFVTVDPWGFYFMPTLANGLLYVTNFPLGVIAFTSILFHWCDQSQTTLIFIRIEVIQTSIRTMKKEHMMKSINVNYRGKEVTVEDMVERVHFLQKLKIPFIAGLICLTLTVYGLVIASGLSPVNSRALMSMMYTLVGLCWLFLLLGFLIYGRRMISIMPFELTRKVTRLTKKLTMLSAFILLCFVVLVPTLFILSDGTKAATLAQYAVVEVLICFICFAICFVFLRWKSSFPFIVWGEGTGRSSGHRSATKESGSNNPVELETNYSSDSYPARTPQDSFS